MTTGDGGKEDTLTFKVLGRTLTHLGTQMYKRREMAIAELVANGWDAGAPLVEVTGPEIDDYDPAKSEIVITDHGIGMTFSEIQEKYLVVARNRRDDGDTVKAVQTTLDDLDESTGDGNGEAKEFSGEETTDDEASSGSDEAPAVPPPDRPVMGRKGIGKLAGFGLARKVTVRTWRDGEVVEFTLDVGQLEAEDGTVEDVPIKATRQPYRDTSAPSGTTVVLKDLKHKTALDPAKLNASLARRFTRKVRGQMHITVNGVELADPIPPLLHRFPEEGTAEATLADGNTVRYWYGFARSAIGLRDLRGFSIMVRGRTAQAPPFFFDVEGTATGQHSTRYVVGDIEADYLDDDPELEDLISTDRQDIDWDDERVAELKKWGDRLSRDLLADCAKKMGENIQNALRQDPEFNSRLEALDKPSRARATQFIEALGRKKEEVDGRTHELANQILLAFEYQGFHDIVEKMERSFEENPDQIEEFLEHLFDWHVVESRAIHRLLEGRLFVIDKFRKMLLDGTPETASKVSLDNIHDMIAEFPWLLEPTWTLINEERSLSTQIQAWAKNGLDAEGLGERFDFLALEDDRTLVVVEIKKPDIPVTLEEVQRLERYQEKLEQATKREVKAILLYKGALDLSDRAKKEYDAKESLTLLPWGDLFDRAQRFYTQYRDVLEGHATTAHAHARKEELKRIDRVRSSGTSYRGTEGRKEGLGPDAQTGGAVAAPPDMVEMMDSDRQRTKQKGRRTQVDGRRKRRVR